MSVHNNLVSEQYGPRWPGDRDAAVLQGLQALEARSLAFEEKLREMNDRAWVNIDRAFDKAISELKSKRELRSQELKKKEESDELEEKEKVQETQVENLNGGGHNGLLNPYLSYNDATGSRSGGGPSISVRNRGFEAKIGDLEDGFHRGEEYGGGGYVGSWLQFERGGAGCSSSGGGPGFFVGGFGEASGESGGHRKCFTSGFGGKIDNGGSGGGTGYYGGGLPRLTSQGGGSMKAGPEASGLGVAHSGGERKKIGFGGRVTVKVGAGGSRTAGGGRDGKGKVVTCGSGGADVDLEGDGGPEELDLVEGSNKGEGGKNNLEGGSYKGGSTGMSVGLQGKLTLDDSSKGKFVYCLEDESAEKVGQPKFNPSLLFIRTDVGMGLVIVGPILLLKICNLSLPSTQNKAF